MSVGTFDPYEIDLKKLRGVFKPAPWAPSCKGFEVTSVLLLKSDQNVMPRKYELEQEFFFAATESGGEPVRPTDGGMDAHVELAMDRESALPGELVTVEISVAGVHPPADAYLFLVSPGGDLLSLTRDGTLVEGIDPYARGVDDSIEEIPVTVLTVNLPVNTEKGDYHIIAGLVDQNADVSLETVRGWADGWLEIR
jgi:hypothetical protein